MRQRFRRRAKQLFNRLIETAEAYFDRALRENVYEWENSISDARCACI